MSTPPPELVATLARDVVAEVAPAELPLFSSTAARYFADPRQALSGGKASDETLGFGAEAAVLLVGPFALELAKNVLTRLMQKLGDAAADGMASRLLRRLQPEASTISAAGPHALDAQQLALVRQTAADEARRLALPDSEATRLANALVAALATRTG